MNKPESHLYTSIKNTLEPCPIVLKRVENSMDLGTPDVFFTSSNNEGWAELKHIPVYPAKVMTKIKVPFRPGQYAWVRERLRTNPKTTNILLIQIGDIVFMYRNMGIQEEYSLKELLGLAVFQHSIKGINNNELFKAFNTKGRI